MNKLTPLRLGWLFSGAYFTLTYLLSTLYLSHFSNNDLAFIENHVGLIRWMGWKGLNRSALDAFALFSLLLTPLSVAGWHFFAIDARPRRPKPTIWHSAFFLAYLLPIAALFQYQYVPQGESSTFKSPLLKFIASSDELISLLFSSSTWLMDGLTYLAVLPIFEIISCRHRRNAND